MAKGTVAVAKETKNPAKLPSILHPPYFQMICEAISSLKDRTGSSQQAIAKFIEENYNKSLPPNFKKVLSIQLKKFVKSEKLVKVKNSFKISVTEKVKIMKKSAVTEKLTNKASNVTIAKVSEKSKKTKQLSQVKTPEVLKKKVSMSSKAKKDVKKTVVTGKTKMLSQVKTPEGLKKNLTPMKRKGSKSGNSSRPAPKKARK